MLALRQGIQGWPVPSSHAPLVDRQEGLLQRVFGIVTCDRRAAALQQGITMGGYYLLEPLSYDALATRRGIACCTARQTAACPPWPET